jgi:hypothetical protein
MNGHRSSSNNPEKLTPSSCHPCQTSPTSFQSLLEYTCSPEPAPLILITSSAAILNLPINSTCHTDNLHLIFPPTLHPSPLLSCNPLVAPFKNTHVMPSLLRVHIHLLSSDRQKISSLCSCVLSSGDLFIFW